MHFCCDATFQWCSLEKVLRASQYMWVRPWSYKCLAPTGLGVLFVVRELLFVNITPYALCNTE